MDETNNSQEKYICCRYCMEINPQLLIPCARLIGVTNLKLHTCPKKRRQDPNSERLKPNWKEITETEYLKIYELSIALKANTDIVVLEDDKITYGYLKRVQNKNSNN